MWTRWLVIFSLVLSLGSGVAAAKETPVTVTSKDDGRTVTLHKGQELRLKLDTNPSTGYSWRIAVDPAPVLTQEGDPTYESERPPSPAIGARGIQIWHFRAVQKGRRTLRMEYRRPWEREVPAGASVTLRIVVE